MPISNASGPPDYGQFVFGMHELLHNFAEKSVFARYEKFINVHLQKLRLTVPVCRRLALVDADIHPSTFTLPKDEACCCMAGNLK